MEAFAKLNVEVAITELDIRTTTPPTAQAQQQQVTDYATTVGACASVDACVGVTVWVSRKNCNHEVGRTMPDMYPAGL